MDGCNRFAKKITRDERGMTLTAPLRKSTTVKKKKMNDRPLLLSVNETTHYFKKWSTANDVSKKKYFLYKNVIYDATSSNNRYT